MSALNLIGHVVRYVAIYLLFISIFVRGAIDKLTNDVPQFFLDGWADTWAATFPGLELSWRLAGLVEASSAVALVVSVVMLEWLPGRSKAMAKIGIGLGLVLFMMLAWGQQLIGATEGIANLWLYFGTAAATMVIVQLDERSARDGTSATSSTSADVSAK